MDWEKLQLKNARLNVVSRELVKIVVRIQTSKTHS